IKQGIERKEVTGARRWCTAASSGAVVRRGGEGLRDGGRLGSDGGATVRCCAMVRQRMARWTGGLCWGWTLLVIRRRHRGGSACKAASSSPEMGEKREKE
ncbi:hypothetical protein U1Q18_047168, partial [Sarracenia purpurea var. burkii]